MERQNSQFSFIDQLTNDLGGKRTAEFFGNRQRGAAAAKRVEHNVVTMAR